MTPREEDLRTGAAARSEPLLQMSLLGEAVEHAPVGVFVFDDEGRYVAVNAYACELLGYSREELLARRLGDLAARPTTIDEYRAAIAGGDAAGVTRARRKDGGEVDLRFRARETSIAGMTFYIGIAWTDDA